MSVGLWPLLQNPPADVVSVSFQTAVAIGILQRIGVSPKQKAAADHLTRQVVEQRLC